MNSKTTAITADCCSFPDLPAALDAIPFGFATLGSNGALKWVNRAFLGMFQTSDVSEASDALAMAISESGQPLAEALAKIIGERPINLPVGVVLLNVGHLEDGSWVLTLAPQAAQLLAETLAKQAQKVALVALADLAEYRDSDTGEHVLRVARMTYEIARAIKQKGFYSNACDDTLMQHIGMASILHDVGKVGVPDAVLLKPGKLTPEERLVIERHSAAGGSIMRKAERLMIGSPQFKIAAEIAEGHHECWDGSGYPHHLAGQDIPLAARIVAVADVFDALTSSRPYKSAWSEEEAISHIRQRSAIQFDPNVVDALLSVLETRKSAVTIKWSDEIEFGHEVIDHDHKMLLALINQIGAPENRSDIIAVEFVLDELLGYTISHFAREEEIMAAAEYPGLTEHQEHHRALFEEVACMQSHLAMHRDDVGEHLSQFLSDWLVRHIMHEDRLYCPYILK